MLAVSVVLPTFNRASSLPRALDSALEQDWPAMEVVVVDDGSTDDTAEVLAEYQRREPTRIRIIRQTASGSPAAARNVGVRQARNPYIAFLDSDDAWGPGKLAKQLVRFESEPDLRFCFTALQIRRDGKLCDFVLEDWIESAEYALHRLLIGCCVTTSTVVVSRQLLLDIDLFDPTLRIVDDYDLWLRVAAAGHRMGYVSEPLTTYEAEGGISDDLSTVSAGLVQVVERLLARSDLPSSIAERRDWYLAQRHLNSSLDFLATGDGRAARTALARAVRARPISVRPGWLLLAARTLTLSRPQFR